MGYLPIFLDVTGKRCLVVGGGEVAERKVASLLDAGAVVTVISPELTPALRSRVKSREVSHLDRAYRTGDVHDFALVFAATDDPTLQRKIAVEAREHSILVNVADAPELCSFIAPAVVNRGALQIAISTGGASPALASRIRRELERQFGAEHAIALDILRAARRRLRGSHVRPAERARRLRALADSDLTACVRLRDLDAVDRLLEEHLGDGVGLDALGLKNARLSLTDRTDAGP